MSEHQYPFPLAVGLIDSGVGMGLLVVHMHDDRLSPDDPHYDCWYLPGGKIELDESPAQCLSRELDEEFAIGVTTPRLLPSAIFHLTFTRADGSRYGVVGLPHYCIINSWPTPNKGELLNLDSKHLEYEWVQPEAIGAFARSHHMSEGAIPVLQAMGWFP